jgi:drug/metabolite transporter (DMT)-like permease
MSVKLGDSVSITLTCMGTMAMFASVLEPIIIGSPFSFKDVLISVIVVCGVVQVYFSLPTKAPNADVEIDYDSAIIWGLMAPFLMALVSVLNKLYINQGTALSIATIEVGAAAALLTVCVPLLYGEETIWYPNLDLNDMSWDTVRDGPFDLIWVVILAGVGTNVCQYLGNKALNHISAFTANLIGILEPIYGIVLGAVLFQENKDLSVDFYYGAGIILFALVANTIFSGIGNPPGSVEHHPVNSTHVNTHGHVATDPTNLSGSSHATVSPVNNKYVSNLRKPKASPGVGTSIRRASRGYSGEDFDNDDVTAAIRPPYPSMPGIQV